MPKIVDRVERRAALAAAAAEAIADEGIEAVTMKGIAARAGVTTGAVTHYFNDKDEVILAALLFVGTATRVLADQLERRPDERDAQLVVAVVDAIGDMASADPTSWPLERQRQLIHHCVERFKVVDDSVPAPSSERQP